MRSALLIVLGFSQTLMAAQDPVYKGPDFDYETPYSEYYKQPEFQKKEGLPRWVGKTCVAAAVSGATYALFALDGLFGKHDPYKPLAAATAAGIVTFMCLSIGDKGR